MKVRIVSKGWENFTGSMGHQAMFKEGVSVEPLTARQIARIGSTVRIVDHSSGRQLGPAEVSRMLQGQPLPVERPIQTQVERDADESAAKAKLIAEADARKVKEAEALAAAQKKAEEQVDALPVYTRQELEAIAANDGITELRKIAEPLKAKGRAITDLIDSILKAQAKVAVA